LVRCHEGSGTNVVVVDQSLDFEPAFGPRSFVAHMSAGGSHLVELNSAEAAFDIDTVADLDRLARGVVPTLLRPFVSRRNQGMSPSLLDPSSLVRLGVEQLVPHAARLRDLGHGSLVTYSRKVFLPLTLHRSDGSDDYYSIFRKDSPIKPQGPLIAWDPIKQKEVWRFVHPSTHNGGALATAGNLVFQGSAEGTFDAFNAVTGAKLWSFPTGGAIMGAPSTVVIDGAEYVFVASGDNGASVQTHFAGAFTAWSCLGQVGRLLWSYRAKPWLGS
jgi:outer membrane protein assembly factor BamB